MAVTIFFIFFAKKKQITLQYYYFKKKFLQLHNRSKPATVKKLYAFKCRVRTCCKNNIFLVFILSKWLFLDSSNFAVSG